MSVVETFTGKELRALVYYFTDRDTAKILHIVDGRRGAAVRKWLQTRPRYWRRRMQVVAIDMSSEFRMAARETLPRAKASLDHFLVIVGANLMITKVHMRRSHKFCARRPWKSG